MGIPVDYRHFYGERQRTETKKITRLVGSLSSIVSSSRRVVMSIYLVIFPFHPVD